MSITINNPVATLVRTAKIFNGVREENDNDGPVPDFCNWWIIRDMRDFPVGGKRARWCSTWVNTVGRLAIGDAWPIPVRPEYSSCDQMVAWAKDNRVFNVGEPNVGDLFVVGNSDDWFHIGIVTAILDENTVETIEGNTNDNGSANGDGVYIRTRSVTGLGFIRWLNVAREI